MNKDENSITSLRDCFAELGLPPVVSEWLCDLFVVIQRIDDIADNGSIPRNELNGLLWKSLVSLPANPFFQQHAHSLIPLLQSAILKWQASDYVERHGVKEQLPKAYVWRAGFYDVVLQCFLIIHGEEAATADGWKVLAMYGEKMADYLTEFEHA